MLYDYLAMLPGGVPNCQHNLQGCKAKPSGVAVRAIFNDRVVYSSSSAHAFVADSFDVYLVLAVFVVNRRAARRLANIAAFAIDKDDAEGALEAVPRL